MVSLQDRKGVLWQSTVGQEGLLFLLFLALYLLTLSRRFSPDSMAFALLATKGDLTQPLFFQAEHLLYPFVGWLWYQPWLLFGYSEGALVPMQTLNAAAGALGVASLFLALRLLLPQSPQGSFLAVVGTLLGGLGSAYWHHATDAEDQIIASALLLVAFLWMALLWRRPVPGPGLILLLAATLGLSILLHATSVLLLPAFGLGAWIASRSWRRLAVLGLGTALVVGVPYVVVGTIVHGLRSLEGYRSWALAAPAVGVWGQWHPGNLWLGAKTFVNSLLSLQGGPNVRWLLAHPTDWGNTLAIALFVVFLGALALGVISSLLMGWRFAFPLVPFTFLWLLPSGAFAAYWAPEDPQFWINPLLAAQLLAVVGMLNLPWIRAGSTLLAVALGTGVLVVAITNLATVLPRSDLGRNEGYAKALCLRDHTKPQDLVIAPGWDWVGSYVPYFAGREVFSLLDTYLLTARGDRQRLMELLADRMEETRAQGGQVFVARLYALPPEDQAHFRRVTGLDAADFSFAREVAWECQGEPIWQVRATPRFPYVGSRPGQTGVESGKAFPFSLQGP